MDTRQLSGWRAIPVCIDGLNLAQSSWFLVREWAKQLHTQNLSKLTRTVTVYEHKRTPETKRNGFHEMQFLR